MQEHRGWRSPSPSAGLRERLRLRLLRCFMRSRTADEPLAEPLPPADVAAQAESSALETRRAAIRSLSGSCVCSGWRTIANSQLAGRELLSSSEQLADEHELEDVEEHDDDDEDEEEQDDASLLASLLALLLLRALR